MANRKVLIIAFSFPPLADASSVRMARVVRRLPELGWEPVVLTSDDRQQMLPDRDYGLLGLIPDSVKVVRIRMIEPYDNFFYRILVGGKKRGRKNDNGVGNSVAGKQDFGRSSPRFKKWKKRIGDFVEALMIPDRFMGWLPFA